MAVSEKFSNFAKTRRSALKAKAAGVTAFAYDLFTDCSLFTPVTLYSSSASLIIGSVLYVDAGLTTPYDADDVVVSGTSLVYYMPGFNGAITDVYICFSSYTAYTDCTELTELGTAYVEGGAYTVVGTLVTTDAEGTSPWASQNFVIGGYQISTDANGLISGAAICGT